MEATKVKYARLVSCCAEERNALILKIKKHTNREKNQQNNRVVLSLSAVTATAAVDSIPFADVKMHRSKTLKTKLKNLLQKFHNRFSALKLLSTCTSTVNQKKNVNEQQ